MKSKVTNAPPEVQEIRVRGAREHNLKGIAAIEWAQAAGNRPWQLGMDLLVLR